MEEGRDTLSSQDSTSMSMLPPRSRYTTNIEQGGTSSRQSSHVWTYFDKEKIPDNSNRFKSHCLVCLQNGREQVPFNYAKGTGMGALNRHLKNIHGITKAGHESGEARRGPHQTQLGGFMTSSVGGGMPFTYNRDKMIEDFATYVTLDELPFSHGESENLEHMVKNSLNPAFRKIPRNTLKRHTIKQYHSTRAQLIEFFQEFDGMVSLTSDYWSSSQGEPYICIMVHWIGVDYLLQKRIIAFDVMDESHSGYNIKQRILDTINEFNLFNKVFTISLDNASANNKCIDYIRSDIPLVLDGVFLHVRCCDHIINLSVQKGISQLTHLLEPIRKVIKYLRLANTFRSRYKKLCKDNGLRPKKWGIDTPTKWSSTYKLLNEAIKYKIIITELYNSDPNNQYEGGFITEFDWELVSTVRDILDCFAHATKIFSYVYEPNVHHVIIECVNIVTTLCDYEDNAYFSSAIRDMKIKWIEYFTEFPYIYGIASLSKKNYINFGLLTKTR